MACYICDVCRDKLSTKQWENQEFQRVSSLEFSFTCSECWKLFSMAFEVTNKDEKECYTFSERNYLLRSHSRQSAIDCPQDYYLTGNCDETEPKFTHDIEINFSALGSQTLPSHECVENFSTYNVQKKKADEKASSNVCKLSSSINSTYKLKECDLKNPNKNQHVNNVPQQMDEISQIYTSPPTVKNGAPLNNQFQTNLNSLINETCYDNNRYKSCFDQPTFKENDKSSLECNICHITLKTVKTFKSHMKKHDENNPYICEVCKKSCSSRGNLIQHMAKHSDKRPYKCNSCSSTFKIKAQLSQHMRAHSEKRPFKCHICSSTFKFRHILYNHMAWHSDERPFKCNICHSTFKRKDYISQHMLIHSEERPNKCHICSSSFKFKNSLKRHILKHINMT